MPISSWIIYNFSQTSRTLDRGVTKGARAPNLVKKGKKENFYNKNAPLINFFVVYVKNFRTCGALYHLLKYDFSTKTSRGRKIWTCPGRHLT